MTTTYDEAPATAHVLRGRDLREADLDAWMRAARTYLPPAPGRVLDLAAGTGRFSAALARTSGTTVVVCEPDPTPGTARRAAVQPQVSVVGGATGALPFADAAFDAVWASTVTHRIDDLPAFARELRRVLAPGGRLLLRGGFGPVFDLPLYRYFPRAWAPGSRDSLALAEVIDVLGGVGLHPAAHLKVGQQYAEDADELLRKVRTRSHSRLHTLTDRDFRAGLRELESDLADERLPLPVTERLDLVVFRSSPRTRLQPDCVR